VKVGQEFSASLEFVGCAISMESSEEQSSTYQLKKKTNRKHFKRKTKNLKKKERQKKFQNGKRQNIFFNFYIISYLIKS